MAIDSAAVDVRDAVLYLVAHADSLGLDRNRLCLWGLSRGGLVLSPAVQALGARLRCLVLYYAIVDPPLAADSGTPSPSTPSLTTFVGSGATFPATLVVRAGRDEPRGNAGLDRFAFTAIRHGTNLDFLAYAQGMHAFDLLDDSPRARQIIARTLEFIQWWTINAERRR
jgi:acetyl esterase/lipase